MKAANDGLRFLLELSLLAALAYGGWHSVDGAARWLLAAAMPLTAATAWGIWLAPRSRARVEDPERLFLELVLFGAAVVALAAAGRERLALIFAAGLSVHIASTFVLGQR